MKALEFLKQERAHHLAIYNDKSIIEQYDESIKELEALTSTTNTSLIYCPIKNSNCILSKCAAYTTHKEPDILKCDSCGDTFRRGERCKNYIKGKPDHIEMTLHTDKAYCEHFKQYVFI